MVWWRKFAFIVGFAWFDRGRGAALAVRYHQLPASIEQNHPGEGREGRAWFFWVPKMRTNC